MSISMSSQFMNSLLYMSEYFVPDQKNIKIGKAGRNRWRGKRPQTRGVAMNPVDHPHGGGEGKTSGGRSPVSPWGQSAKGLKTRRPKRSDKLIITRRKKRKS